MAIPTARPAPSIPALAERPGTAVRGLVVQDPDGARRLVIVHEGGVLEIEGMGRHRIVEDQRLSELRGAFAAGRAGRI
jgi:hypothetical protein